MPGMPLKQAPVESKVALAIARVCRQSHRLRLQIQLSRLLVGCALKFCRWGTLDHVVSFWLIDSRLLPQRDHRFQVIEFYEDPASSLN